MGNNNSAKIASSRLKLMFFVLGSFLFLGAVHSLFGGPKTAKDEAAEIADRESMECKSTITAFVKSQRYVREFLRSPSSAEFGSYSPQNVRHEGDCVHFVNSYVDAQNAFGAVLRTPYSARVRYIGQGNWRLVSLDFKQP